MGIREIHDQKLLLVQKCIEGVIYLRKVDKKEGCLDREFRKCKNCWEREGKGQF